jgi:hypothetical protein
MPDKLPTTRQINSAIRRCIKNGEQDPVYQRTFEQVRKAVKAQGIDLDSIVAWVRGNSAKSR